MTPSPSSSRALWVVLVVLSGILGSPALQAEPVDYLKRIKPTTIKLDETDDATGIVGKNLRGTTPREAGKALHFVVKGLNIMHPVQVMLISLEPGKDLTLQIHKFNWDEDEATLTTRDQVAAKTFRTEGGVGFRVSSAEPGVPYILRVRRGEPLPAVREVPFVTGEAARTLIASGGAASATNAAAAEEGGSGVVLYLILGVLVVIAAFLGKLVLSRRGSAAVLVVGFLWLADGGTSLKAQRALSDADLKAEIDKLRDLTGEGGRAVDQASGEFEDMVGELKKLEEELDDRYGREPKAPAPAPADKDNKYAADPDSTGGGDKPPVPPAPSDAPSERSGDAAGIERLQRRIQELERKIDALTPQDADCIPGRDSGRTPPLPSLCAGDPDCEACFAAARAEIEVVQGLFGRLNAIYRSTQDFARIQVRKGDLLAATYPGSIAGANFNALAWEKEKISIEKSLSDMDRAYVAKFAELRDRVDVQLRNLAECEKKYGVPDWYERFGMLYILALDSGNLVK